MIKKVVIPIAGLGTRMFPVTKVVPKEMLPIINRPVIDYIIREVVNASFNHIIFIVSKNKDILQQYLEQELSNFLSDITIDFIEQEKALGLGNAIFLAQCLTKQDPFAVALPDDVLQEDSVFINMQDIFQKTSKSVLSTIKVAPSEAKEYGIIEKLTANNIEKVIEKPQKKYKIAQWGIIGRYIFTPQIYDYLNKVTLDARGEIQLTTALYGLITNNKLLAYKYGGLRFDCGSPKGILDAQIYFSKYKRLI